MIERCSVITLFAEEPEMPRRSASAFAVSVMAHGLGFSLLLYTLHSAPRIIEGALRYPVRMMSLTLTAPLPHPVTARGSSNAQPSPAAGAKALAASTEGRLAARSLAQLAPRPAPAPQTLIQADMPAKILLPHPTPLPQVVLWRPETMPVAKIVPPAPQELTSATTKPSLTPPNHEQKLAEVKVSASLAVTAQAPIEPSNMTPLVIHNPSPVERIAETSSPQQEPPTPTAVLSITPVRVAEGTVALPSANQAALSAPAPGPATAARPVAGLATGTGNAGSGTGSGSNSISRSSDYGGGKDMGDPAKQAGGKAQVGEAGSARDASGGSVAGRTAAKGAGQAGAKPGDQAGAVPDSDGTGAVDRLTFPKDGQFGAVVVGSSMEDVYPETVGIWTDRLAYTVYLHVGLAKSWILQYALPRTSETISTARPEAPWPYDILRPRIDNMEMNADAMLVHGFVDKAGHFNRLSVAFPPDFAQARFIVSALQKWQFRPAMQQGQATEVEVLLIIPEAQQ